MSLCHRPLPLGVFSCKPSPWNRSEFLSSAVAVTTAQNTQKKKLWSADAMPGIGRCQKIPSDPETIPRSLRHSLHVGSTQKEQAREEAFTTTEEELPVECRTPTAPERLVSKRLSAPYELSAPNLFPLHPPVSLAFIGEPLPLPLPRGAGPSSSLLTHTAKKYLLPRAPVLPITAGTGRDRTGFWVHTDTYA
ncbi:hypothetical protein SKAU_G00147290 [Synaphobranchus kaupii]|uniref:Uncharacterized protein n=1 Tax=Synaphobranchus kaupii TaxID=118154 RepID=A0A9Q1J4V6_SYNKA|nr:hypothetical protein SKAU_G00147290 [Synaphobranchus kaupii]